MRGLEIEYRKDLMSQTPLHHAKAVKHNGKEFHILSGQDLFNLKELAPKKLKRLVENPPTEFRRFLNA